MPWFDPWYLAAAVLAAATCAIHVRIGGRLLVRPLLASRELHRVVIVTHYYCWHLVTISIALLAVGFALAAIDPRWRLLGIAATFACALFAALNLGLALRHRLPPQRLPQWVLFAATAAVGAFG